MADTLRVVIPPQPILTPVDIPGSHAANDPRIIALIAAATAEIDGPDGWVGRAFGPQTLELTGWLGGCRRIFLPCRPIIKIVSVVVEDYDGAAETVEPSAYRLDGKVDLVATRGATWHQRPVQKIRYEAGYDGVAVEQDGTGEVPAQAKQAITLAVLHMLSLGAENLFLRSEEVAGIGSRTYTVSDQAAGIIRKATEGLLAGLRVYQ